MEPTTFKYTSTCPICKEKNKDIVVETMAWEKWVHGMLIQKAFPTLSVDERELIQTGICTVCWNEMNPED